MPWQAGEALLGSRSQSLRCDICLYEEWIEACLLEMRILRQGISKSKLAHDAETEAVREGIGVITVLQQKGLV